MSGPRPLPAVLRVAALAAGLAGCAAPPAGPGPVPRAGWTIEARADQQWTGIGVSPSDRVFVNFPRWGDALPMSVAELRDGTPVPWPDAAWNTGPGAIGSSFVCVQSVVADDRERLWVLDTGNPRFAGVGPGGACLYVFDLATGAVDRAYRFPADRLDPDSYLNDVRVDSGRGFAYLTDSGVGGIVVLDLESGAFRRRLTGHRSVLAETDHLVCAGHRWTRTVHSDGIALAPDRRHLYYAALSGHTLYRVPSAALADLDLPEAELARRVQTVRSIPATDGMLFDTRGDLWLGGLEDNSVRCLRPDGMLITVARDPEIRWADSFAEDPRGHLWFTTSQIHLPADERGPYSVIRLDPGLRPPS